MLANPVVGSNILVSFGKPGFVLLFISRWKSFMDVSLGFFSLCAHFIWNSTGGGGEEELKES